MRIRKTINICIKCDAGGMQLSRRMCVICYMREYHYGRHLDYPTTLYRADELVDAANVLLDRGINKWDVAEMLGVKWGTIVTARWRLRRRMEQREGENSEADLKSAGRDHDA